MDLHIRPAVAADFPRILEIQNTEDDPPGTLADMEHFERTRDPGRPFFRLVAEADGRIAGVCSGGSVPWVRDVDMGCWIVVDPPYRRRGIGGALYEATQPFFGAHRPQFLRSAVKDSQPESLAWAERRGFRKLHHIFDSTQDLTAFDPGAFRAEVQQVLAQGIRFVRFDAIRSPATEERLWRLHLELLDDVPDAADRPRNAFADWRKWFLDGPHAWFPGYMVAKDAAGNWAGITLMMRSPESPERAHISITGVARAHRGRGIALALKVAAAEFAAGQGVQRLKTNNHSANAAMLAINRRLGYVPDPGTFLLARPMQGA